MSQRGGEDRLYPFGPRHPAYWRLIKYIQEVESGLYDRRIPISLEAKLLMLKALREVQRSTNRDYPGVTEALVEQTLDRQIKLVEQEIQLENQEHEYLQDIRGRRNRPTLKEQGLQQTKQRAVDSTTSSTGAFAQSPQQDPPTDMGKSEQNRTSRSRPVSRRSGHGSAALNALYSAPRSHNSSKGRDLPRSPAPTPLPPSAMAAEEFEPYEGPAVMFGALHTGSTPGDVRADPCITDKKPRPAHCSPSMGGVKLPKVFHSKDKDIDVSKSKDAHAQRNDRSTSRNPAVLAVAYGKDIIKGWIKKEVTREVQRQKEAEKQLGEHIKKTSQAEKGESATSRSTLISSFPGSEYNYLDTPPRQSSTISGTIRLVHPDTTKDTVSSVQPVAGTPKISGRHSTLRPNSSSAAQVDELWSRAVVHSQPMPIDIGAQWAEVEARERAQAAANAHNPIPLHHHQDLQDVVQEQAYQAQRAGQASLSRSLNPQELLRQVTRSAILDTCPAFGVRGQAHLPSPGASSAASSSGSDHSSTRERSRAERWQMAIATELVGDPTGANSPYLAASEGSRSTVGTASDWEENEVTPAPPPAAPAGSRGSRTGRSVHPVAYERYLNRGDSPTPTPRQGNGVIGGQMWASESDSDGDSEGERSVEEESGKRLAWS